MKGLMIAACALGLAGCAETRFNGLERAFDTIPKMRIWGSTKVQDAETAVLYTIRGAGGLTLEVSNYGGRLVRCLAPDRDGKLADVTLGWNTVAEYEKNGFSMGTLIGRYGNRIRDGRFNPQSPIPIQKIFIYHFKILSIQITSTLNIFYFNLLKQ